MSQVPPPPPSQPTPASGASAASNTQTNVKWNAAQSVVVLGGIWLIGLIVSIVFAPLGAGVYLVAVIYWIIFLIGAFNYQGGHIKAPGIAQFTDGLTDNRANAVK